MSLSQTGAALAKTSAALSILFIVLALGSLVHLFSKTDGCLLDGEAAAFYYQLPRPGFMVVVAFASLVCVLALDLKIVAPGAAPTPAPAPPRTRTRTYAGKSNFAAYHAGQALLAEPAGPPPEHIAYEHERLADEDLLERSLDFLELMQSRRTIRFISRERMPRQVIDRCIEAAATAPSGAHCQPWHFAVVESAGVKQDIREMVEAEEKLNYDRRMSKQWVGEVEGMVGKLPTAYTKPYLTDAPYLIVVFKKKFDLNDSGEKVLSRYAEESVGIACGILLAALQAANLVTLTSTPMGAEGKIRELLGRPKHEKVFLLLPVGWPSSEATVPYRDDTQLRQPLDRVMSSH